jgi:hypothetical protein
VLRVCHRVLGDDADELPEQAVYGQRRDEATTALAAWDAASKEER